MGKQLNPLEKEFLIRTYRAKPEIPLNDFCYINNVSITSMRKWMHLYDEGGLDALARQTGPDEILPEGVDRTEENYKREILKLRIEEDDVPALIERYINFYNEMRPCYALGYNIPNHYEQKYRNGELKMRNTFKDRILTGTHKFIQKKLSTFIDWYNYPEMNESMEIINLQIFFSKS